MKNIIFGVQEGSLGDAIMLLPVVNQSNFILQTDSYNNRYEIFKENCRIDIVKPEELIREEKSIELFGDKTKISPPRNACVKWCDVFGINTSNYIPSINLTKNEENWANNFISQFKKPVIVFTPVCAGYKDNPDEIRSFKVFPFGFWKIIIGILSVKYDILYVCKENEYVPFDGNYTPILDLGIRQTAALLNKSGIYLGIDTGIRHLAIASKAKEYTLVPTYGWGPNYYFPCFGYTKELWINEECRSNYYLFQEWQRLIGDLLVNVL